MSEYLKVGISHLLPDPLHMLLLLETRESPEMQNKLNNLKLQNSFSF